MTNQDLQQFMEHSSLSDADRTAVVALLKSIHQLYLRVERLEKDKQALVLMVEALAQELCDDSSKIERSFWGWKPLNMARVHKTMEVMSKAINNGNHYDE